MAQALEKMNVSPNLGKLFYVAPKMVIFFQNSVFGEIQFSQKSLTNRKKTTPYPFTTCLSATNPNNILLLLQAPRAADRTKCGTAAKRRYRKKKLNISRSGCAATGAHRSKRKAQYQTFKRAIVRFSGTRSCGDIIFLKFFRKLSRTPRSIRVKKLVQRFKLNKVFSLFF